MFAFGGFVGVVGGPLFAEDLFEGFLAGGGVVFGLGGQGAKLLVEGDIFYGFRGLRDGFGEIAGGYLQGVEQEAGALGVELVGGEAAHDFARIELDGGAVVGL